MLQTAQDLRTTRLVARGIGVRSATFAFHLGYGVDRNIAEGDQSRRGANVA